MEKFFPRAMEDFLPSPLSLDCVWVVPHLKQPAAGEIFGVRRCYGEDFPLENDHLRCQIPKISPPAAGRGGAKIQIGG